jgi:Asp/Glu/hydantoin racemase
MPVLTWLEATEGAPELDPLWRFLAEQIESASAGRFETKLRHMSSSMGGVRHPATRLLNDAGLLASAVAAEPESDVMVLGCWGSPVHAVRSAVSVPVASLPEASALAVAAFARSAVVVTVAPSLVPIFTAEVRQFGGVGFAAGTPVRAYDPESTHGNVVDAILDPATLIDRFNRVAVRAVEDGADAIVVGCGYLAPIFSAHGYTTVTGHPDVPVYDCNRVAIEHAASLYQLHRAGIRPAQRSYAPPQGAKGAAFARALSTLTAHESKPQEGTGPS